MDQLRGGFMPGLLGNGMGTVGAGSSYAAETEAIAAAFTTPPTTARKNLIDACVVSLKSAGVWSKLDALYAFAAADSQAAKINWKNPGTYNCTEVNAPAFTADQGFTGDGGTKYLDSGFNPTTAPSPKLTQNDGSLFGWCLTDADISGGMIGVTSLDSSYLIPRRSGTTLFALTSGTGVTPANTAGLGFYSGSRESSSTVRVYKNATQTGVNAAATSAALANLPFVFLRISTQFWAGQCAAGGFGSQLSAADNTALYNALAAYMAGLATDRIAAAFTTPPSAGRKTLIQNCVTSLMQGGVWDKLDALYAFAAADSQAAKINWKAPGTFNCTEVNAPAFAADLGFTGGAGKYLDSGFNPSSAPTPKYVLNDATVFGWSLSSAGQTPAMLGTVASAVIAIYPKELGTGNVFVRINCGNINTAVTTTALGLTAATRTGATATAVYRDGASIHTSATASTGTGAVVITFLHSDGAYWLGQMAAAGIGGGLNSTEQLALYNALRTYLTGVGVP